MASTVRYIFWMSACIHQASCAQVNVALHKNTSTTSGIYDYPAGETWHPSGAVDGDHDTLDLYTSCFHSNMSPSDWTVDLGQRYQLYNITVYIRLGFEYRTANSSIYVDNDPNRVCCTFPSTISDNPTNLTCNETARYVTIRNPGDVGVDDTLNICEVEIYACSNGSYGTDCELDCQCSSCDRWSGICSACASSRYGKSCASECSARHCVGGSSCESSTGRCDGGCDTGWTGVDCTACVPTQYGKDCANECARRRCIGDSSCESTTGQCDEGCQDGWTGADCSACAASHYGESCARECSARRCEGDSSCDSTTGRCDSGCQPGWTGTDCWNREARTEASSNTTLILSATALTTVGVLVVGFIIIGVFLWKRRMKNRERHLDNMISSKPPQQNRRISTDESNVYTSPDRVEITPPAPYETLNIQKKTPKIYENMDTKI